MSNIYKFHSFVYSYEYKHRSSGSWECEIAPGILREKITISNFLNTKIVVHDT